MTDHPGGDHPGGDAVQREAAQAPAITQRESGWPVHFICGRDCAFHRATLLTRVTDGEEVVVSTVGAMRHPTKRDGSYDTVGPERYYETMAFAASHEKCGCFTADVSRQYTFDADWAISDPDACRAADAMHETVVAEFRTRLERGEKMLAYAEREAAKARAMPSDTITIPRRTAELIRRAFLPTNPNKLRTAAPEVKQAAKDFIALVEGAQEGESDDR